MYSDYFVTAVKMIDDKSGVGQRGKLSFLLVENNMQGFKKRKVR
jgi:hypothetical protein